MEAPEKYYEEKLQELKRESTKLKKTIRWLVLLRLITFLAVFPCVFYLIPTTFWLGIILSLLAISSFLVSIKTHLRFSRKLKHVEALMNINTQELNSLSYEFDDFYPGNEFVDTSHPYSYDMDLFGSGSLFQFINRTVTHSGRRKLAELLTEETLEAGVILDRQIAVKELSSKPELIQDFRAAGSLNSDDETDLSIIRQWITEPEYYLVRKGLVWLTGILPVITLTTILLAFVLPFFRGLAIVLFLTQLLIVGLRLSHTSREHEKLGKRLEALKKYQSLLDTMGQAEYTGNELKSIDRILTRENVSATSSIKALVKILSAFDNRLNILAAIFLEGLLLWDLQCMIRLEQWKTGQGNHFSRWIDALARFDALVSLATFAFNQSKLTYPVISDNVFLDAKQLGHVLIAGEERICNDFRIEKQGDFVIITGANMAGKSTFLRTVVTNMILAMTGAPVCASSFLFRPVLIFSSMRTSDSLNKHESYFYAELRRLKEMLERLRGGERLFIILDEILKGTNSEDKQKGSYAALRKILELNGTGILATHDLYLASIEKIFPERIKNMCFEVDIDNAGISFDYILRQGITTKMNALLLMQQMGIISG